MQRARVPGPFAQTIKDGPGRPFFMAARSEGAGLLSGQALFGLFLGHTEN
jgi:hypothetical protein